LASDLRNDTRLCPTFDDAVVRHRLLDAIETSAKSGERVTITGR
jgi:predicted dehydrogenase